MIKNNSFKRISLAGVIALSTYISACSPTESNKAINTGDAEYETSYGLLNAKQATASVIVYVASPRLNIRSEPNTNPDSIVGTLEMNDMVQIVDGQQIGEQKFLAVRIVKSQSLLDKNTVYYTSMNYLNPTAINIPKESLAAQKIFVVSNIATEKTRVYQRCEAGENCINKLIFEQDVVNGEDDNGRKSDVGNYRVTSWEKFYETPGVYPAWYKEGYPAVPAPKSSMSAWFNKSYMPEHTGTMRGAFGWYTAKVGPNPNGQWMHGTAGWGQDKQSFILFKNSFIGAITNIFKAIRSHGCTRIDNESIAYLRNLVPVGATYIKIYAKEAYRNAKVGESKKTGSWSYILTKNQNEVADRETVLKNGTPQSAWIEQGTLSFLQTATAVPANKKGSDLYDIGDSAFKGYFIVDEGTVLDYQHPDDLSVGGYTDHTLPNFMQTNNDEIIIPEPAANNAGPNIGAGGLIPGH